jgi:hypothetical protein
MQSNTLTPWQWFSSLDGGDLAGLLFLGLSGLVIVMLIVSMTAYFMHKNRLQHDLKRDMLDRGFSAEEIALAMHGTPSKDTNAAKVHDPFRSLQVKS